MIRAALLALSLAILPMLLPAIATAQPALTIYTYNYAKIRKSQMRMAVETATRILGEAGIQTRWISNDDLTADEVFGDSSIALRVLSSAPTYLPSGAAGFAPLDEITGHGAIATVFRDRIAQIVQWTHVVHWRRDHALPRATAEALVMGHVMAHEVGHLLLGVGGHGSEGLMMHPWGARELRQVARSGLGFTAAEAARMQSFCGRVNNE